MLVQKWSWQSQKFVKEIQTCFSWKFFLAVIIVIVRQQNTSFRSWRRRRRCRRWEWRRELCWRRTCCIKTLVRFKSDKIILFFFLHDLAFLIETGDDTWWRLRWARGNIWFVTLVCHAWNVRGDLIAAAVIDEEHLQN